VSAFTEKKHKGAKKVWKGLGLHTRLQQGVIKDIWKKNYYNPYYTTISIMTTGYTTLIM
jgi:hypothetical protein